MATLNDYLAWRGDISFSQVPPCEVDGLIFSVLSYIDFEGIIPTDRREKVRLTDAVCAYLKKHPIPEERKLGLLIAPQIVELFLSLSVHSRFSELLLCGYVNEICQEREMQFSALTVELPDDVVFVAFRGTDDNIVGWKEDFNLSFLDEVPSHRKAVEYLESTPVTIKTRIYVVGHSKGGHLAVWSAVYAQRKIRDKIVRVYSNDGPGFLPSVIQSNQYAEMADRITTLVPQSSLIGLLLDNDRAFHVIKSRRTGLLQHNPLCWEILGSKFIRMEKLSPQGIKNDTVVRARIAAMTVEERKKLTEVIFELISSTGASTLSELSESKLKNALTLIRAMNELDKDTKETVMIIIAKLLDLRSSHRVQKKANGDIATKKNSKTAVAVEFLPSVKDIAAKEKHTLKNNEKLETDILKKDDPL